MPLDYTPGLRRHSPATPSAISVMRELNRLAARSPAVDRLFRKFLNGRRCLAALKLNRRATVCAGHPVYRDEPSTGLLRCLAAARAIDRKHKVSRNAFSFRHNAPPSP